MHRNIASSERALHRPPRRWLARLHHLLALHRSRKHLARLEPHLLDDIGIGPEQVRAELRRSILDGDRFAAPRRRNG